MELTLVVLSFSVLVSLVFIGFLYFKNVDLQKKMTGLKKAQEDLVSIDPGDRALLPEYGLTTIDTNENFHVTYEIEITEVSMDKVKVNAVDYTSNDKFDIRFTSNDEYLELMGIVSNDIVCLDYWVVNKYKSLNHEYNAIDNCCNFDDIYNKCIQKVLTNGN